MARELTLFDALFGQIVERAKDMLDVAQVLRRAVTEATANARDVAVPLYGTARAATIAGLRVPDVERLVIDGTPTRDLELPPERRWTVDAVDTWSPQLPTHQPPVERSPARQHAGT